MNRRTMCVFAVCLLTLPGCAIVTQDKEGNRKTFVLGFAVLEMPDAREGPITYELKGIGLSMGNVLSLGYFNEFQVRLDKDSDSAVVVVRSKEEREHLEKTLERLNQEGLWIVSKN